MTCTRVELAAGITAIVCHRGPRSRPAKCFYCKTPHIRLCDHPIAPGKTCSRKLCQEHATSTGADLDLCVDHATPPKAAPTRLAGHLQFWTGCIHQHRKDPDALDITIMTGGPSGRPFAPSMGIFVPARRALEQVERLRLEAEACRASDLAQWATLEADAARIERETWGWYRRAYCAEMCVSSGRDAPAGWERDVREAKLRGTVPHIEAWTAELAHTRRVYLCFCKDRTRCHGGQLALIMVKLGAEYMGELAATPPQQLALI